MTSMRNTMSPRCQKKTNRHDLRGGWVRLFLMRVSEGNHGDASKKEDDMKAGFDLPGEEEQGRTDGTMTVLVSACLLGMNCKYNGGNNYSEKLAEFLRDKVVIAVCPEVMGGLPTPRIPSEIVDGVVMNREGECVDGAFRLGAERILQAIGTTKIDLAILQPRSPSCGVGQVYDGTFSGKLTEGNGIFAQRLQEAGIRTVTVEWLEREEGAADGNQEV